MALPLTLGQTVIGALTVQSVEEAAFADEDVFSLKAMADQLAVAINNARLHHQNADLFRKASRRAALLQAGSEVSRNITSILDLNVLLSSTVHIICEEYRFYYAGIFLIETLEDGQQWAVLKAGRGEPGRVMMEKGHKLLVGGNSMIGAATKLSEARIALDVGKEAVWFNNPHLPRTRSEMAMPLIVQDRCIGALTIQSEEEAAFSEEDISSLQMMADQLAVAINNARLLKDLERANNELVRTKMYETIATATGETIHWVGNKAAPIPGCVDRTREDVGRFLYLAGELLARADESVQADPLAQLIMENSRVYQQHLPNLAEQVEQFRDKPLKKLKRLLNAESILEDLDSIQKSADTILQIKEDLIGPARRQKRQPADLVEVIKDNIKGFALPPNTVSYSVDGVIPLVYIDPVQLGRVVLNLVKNAMEAMDDQPSPHIFIAVRQMDANIVAVDIDDNGSGIPAAELNKIWLPFHTSKANPGGPGGGGGGFFRRGARGGPNWGGVWGGGGGSTFTLQVPIYKGQDVDEA
jgi:K+-sensing histidine kinase KdpD